MIYRLLLAIVWLGSSFLSAAPAPQNTYSIVFVHIGDQLPDYIEWSIKQARLFNPDCPIYLIASEQTEPSLPPLFNQEKISFVPYESLPLSTAHKSFLNKTVFKDHFWRACSERFLYLNDLIQNLHLKNVIHLENDIMIYVNFADMLGSLTACYPNIAATFDHDDRCIPGLIYIANEYGMNSLAHFFAHVAPKGYNDMQVLALYKDLYGKINVDHLPIIMPEYLEEHELRSASGLTPKTPSLYTSHIDLFDSIFDAACIGQYLGGEIFNKREGFINEQCLFQPNFLEFEWKMDELGRKIPYAKYGERSYRINNLHIHSKIPEPFYSYNNTFVQ